MKLDASITADGKPVPYVSISAGESLEIPVSWQNSDGTPRNMTAPGVSIAVETRSTYPTEAVVDAGATYDVFLDEAGAETHRLLLSTSRSAALVPGKYLLRVTETRTGPEPDTVSRGEVEVHVE